MANEFLAGLCPVWSAFVRPTWQDRFRSSSQGSTVVAPDAGSLTDILPTNGAAAGSVCGAIVRHGRTEPLAGSQGGRDRLDRASTLPGCSWPPDAGDPHRQVRHF